MASPAPVFAVKLWNRRPSSDELLADMRRVAHANDGALTFDLYGRHGEYSTNTIAHRFGSWGAALQAAGLRVNIDRGLSDAQLFENLAEVWRKLGRQPIGRDLVKSQGVSRYSSGAYEARFGSWNRRCSPSRLPSRAPSARTNRIGQRKRLSSRDSYARRARSTGACARPS